MTEARGTVATRAAVDGELLSCYGAAIAAYLDALGADWLDVLGRDSTLRLRSAGEGVYAFRHLPAGLRAVDGPLPLERTGAHTAPDAVAGIEAELRSAGAVIVVGDAFHLPWLTAHRRRHAVHWFVLDGRWHVRDEFAATDDLGRQQPWHGGVAAADLASLLAAPSQIDPVERLQDRHAFGDEEPPRDEPYQWYRRRTGERPAPDPGGGWLAGPAAVRALARHFAVRGHRADAYLQAEELWTAARQRLLHSRRHPDSAALAALAEQWRGLPMLLRYARLSVDRPGRARHATVAEALRRLADLEEAARPAGAPDRTPDPTAPAR
ncbi:MAG: hypothetical protein ACJ786_40400 [Catenulispora sp.]